MQSNTILTKQVNASEIDYTEKPCQHSIARLCKKTRFFIESAAGLDMAPQKEQLRKDLDYQKGFLHSVEKKLSNERFVQNAKPEVIESERKKKADAEAKIKALEESL